MVRTKNVDLLYEIIRLQRIEKREKLEIVEQLSAKFAVDATTIYRNISEVDSYIKHCVQLFKMLSITSLNKAEFKDDFDKVKNSLT